MSNVERMDIRTAVRTVLEKNPGIKAKELIEKVRGKTGLSRSTIYEHLSSFVTREMIHREKGRYWLEKPDEGATGFRLLKQLEEKLGSELDLGGLLLRVHSLNNLMKSGASVSLRQAEITKGEIESDIKFIKLGMNEDDPRFSEKETLLNALRDHLKLAVDSLVKQ